ncbi:MAG TPA: ATP--guanido phosphotransferase, partial [Armatimonadota bacterium]
MAISTRARLARNIQGSPFPTRANEADLKRVADILLDVVHGAGEGVDKLRVVYPSHLSDSERLAFINARLASRQQMNGGRYSPIVLNDAGTLSLMINEEDHLRIQCILPGFDPMSALQTAEVFDNLIGSKVIYARSDNYGYLTSSLANIGTGLRISVMLHLAGLALLEEDFEVLTAAA